MIARSANSVLIRILSAFAVFIIAAGAHGEAQQRPNFLVIVADDMGWSDLGFFGSEIHTPTLDSMAAHGVTMTNFYVAPTCSPTRAMLMTGVDNHLAGLGTMEGVQAKNQLNAKGYSGQLRNDVVTVAEGLKSAGYTTLMSGKWHLAKERSEYPSNRGFDRSFALIEGGASHFSDAEPLYRIAKATYIDDGVVVKLPGDFYSSKAYTDKMLEYLNSADSNTPFFAYVAYTAPHDPLQVPADWIDRYAGVYDVGPEAIRAQRTQNLVKHGFIPTDTKLWSTPKFPAFLPAHIEPWAKMTKAQRQAASKPMEIYASMIEYMDMQIRRLLDELAQSGRLQNTYVIFLSDNGANGATPLSYPGNTREWYLHHYKQRLEDQGLRGSHTYLGREWASAAAAPFKLYKGTIAEGGIRSPMIVNGPLVAKNKMSKQLAHVTDLPATLYALAGVDPQRNAIFRGKHLPEGKSLLSNWEQPSQENSRTFAAELFGHRAVISDNWKATNMRPPLGDGKWELYDLTKDPGETNNLAEKYPQKLQELEKFYRDYKKRVGVVPPKPPVMVSFGDLFTTQCNWYCRSVTHVVDFLAGLWVKFSVPEE